MKIVKPNKEEAEQKKRLLYIIGKKFMDQIIPSLIGSGITLISNKIKYIIKVIRSSEQFYWKEQQIIRREGN